ncbi:GntR family transcriptional regulator [Flagellimonas taeanensis]|uniref:GntR family transcriptional regulator n=1 Tax=Flavobacteriaceae TaxID=49546 RepID=UPI000E6878BE|nr:MULTISPECIES: GntR family transcriptional regulator [Allomuricauda]MDC6386147.1 GntR family transcriptional regulator [Muricauda sp. SK9]RIV50377.1 GntR family transcriptional regulator [Allomuricauda taeanensis]
MKSQIEILLDSNEPFYKQLVNNIQYLIESGIYKSGDFLPSLNDLAAELDISKETVKKAYSLLRKRGVLESAHGKGYYVTNNGNGKIKILLLFDKLGTYKQEMFNAFVKELGTTAEIVIRLHNQDIVAFEELLEDGLDHYDYYVITPHFPLTDKIQKKVLSIVGRIPNRKLILLDHNLEHLPGNFGSIYQDYEEDTYLGLLQGLDTLKKFKKLNVISMAGSLYAPQIQKGIKKFCQDYGVPYEMHQEIVPSKIRENEAFLILNGQLDEELIELARVAKSKDYVIGKNIGIISYNDSPINEIILDGLTALSTNFQQMGELAGKMILEKSLKKIKCDYKLVRRNSF